jgi:hypothetical protein
VSFLSHCCCSLCCYLLLLLASTSSAAASYVVRYSVLALLVVHVKPAAGVYERVARWDLGRRRLLSPSRVVAARCSEFWTKDQRVPAVYLFRGLFVPALILFYRRDVGGLRAAITGNAAVCRQRTNVLGRPPDRSKRGWNIRDDIGTKRAQCSTGSGSQISRAFWVCSGSNEPPAKSPHRSPRMHHDQPRGKLTGARFGL